VSSRDLDRRGWNGGDDLLGVGLEPFVREAFVEARRRGHRVCEPTHLLLALAQSEAGAAELRNQGARLVELQTRLKRICQPAPDDLLARIHYKVRLRAVQWALAPHVMRPVVPSKELSSVVARSVLLRAQDRASGGSAAKYLLAALRSHVPAHIAEILAETGLARDPSRTPRDGSELHTADFVVDLTAAARDGRRGAVIGRDREIVFLRKVLARQHRSSVFVVGDSGVGKTSIVDGLARAFASDPDASVRVLKLEREGLRRAATTAAFERSLREALRPGRPGSTVLAVTARDFVSLLSSGEHALVRALLRLAEDATMPSLVACVTPEAYAMLERIEPQLDEFSQRLVVAPLPRSVLLEILCARATELERHHGVRFCEPALLRVIEICEEARPTRLPGAALRLLDEAGAAARATRDASAPATALVDARTIDAALRSSSADMIPPASTTGPDLRLRDLEQRLGERILGQDDAIARVCAAIFLSRAALDPSTRPVGCFLFIGPTGVGKTELARQLAFALEIPLIRFDMSEYREGHSVARLIGAPPGYVGYEQGGLLTHAVRAQPEAVLLLDEIEKASPHVFNLLLQVMDHGTLTDNAGVATSFRRVLLIMTSNVGANETPRRAAGFSPEAVETSLRHPVTDVFAAEFLARIDARVEFSALGPDTARALVRKALDALAEKLASRDVELQIGEDAMRHFAAQICAPSDGARGLQRMLASALLVPIARELLFGSLVNGGIVRVTTASGEIRLSCAATGERPNPAPGSSEELSSR